MKDQVQNIWSNFCAEILSATSVKGKGHMGPPGHVLQRSNLKQPDCELVSRIPQSGHNGLGKESAGTPEKTVTPGNRRPVKDDADYSWQKTFMPTLLLSKVHPDASMLSRIMQLRAPGDTEGAYECDEIKGTSEILG